MKIQQTQVQQDRTKTLTEFRKDGKVNLRYGPSLLTTDYLSVIVFQMIQMYISTRITEHMKMKYHLPLHHVESL